MAKVLAPSLASRLAAVVVNGYGIDGGGGGGGGYVRRWTGRGIIKYI
jgi:hypothetical protein